MAQLTSSDKHETWSQWNRELSAQGITTGADKWDVLVSIWQIDQALEAMGDAGETLDGKSVLEAKAVGDALLVEQDALMRSLLPETSRDSIGDDAYGLLIGLVAQARDKAFRPLPVEEQPVE